MTHSNEQDRFGSGQGQFIARGNELHRFIALDDQCDPTATKLPRVHRRGEYRQAAAPELKRPADAPRVADADAGLS
jgi:hypothetical protein